MHTTQEWFNSAENNMSHAFHTQKKASRQCDTSRRAHDVTVADNLDMYNNLHDSLEQKVKTSYRLIDKLQKRADSIENSIKQSRQSLDQLEAAYRAKDAPLQLCVWRMEQREKRPLREQVRDHVEVALEDEKATLMDTQRRLAEAIRRTKSMIGGLESKFQEVRHDLEQKRQALGVDEMCLRTTHRSWQSVVERAPPHRAASVSAGGRLPSAGRTRNVHHQAAYHESSKNEVNRQQEAHRLNHSGAAREDASKELRDDNNKLISRCERAAEEAVRKAEQCMQDRISENQQMRRRLANELQETHGKIDNTKRTITETKNQMKSLEEPIELTTTCSSWRKHRAAREHIEDPVSTKLSVSQNMLLRSHEELRNHHQNEKSVLQDLNDHRDRLKEDLRDKTAALHIDLNCLTHEATHLNGRPSKALSKNKMTRALKVDPNFVPMPSVNTRTMEMPLTAR